ncbi:phosphatase PAP2 family protein [Paenibacillus lutrae]|uniref:Phosphatase PAP2 family protein n=1 Tax=Paenibacillus lutrae TaxID=2078573 RepID=A0A7X3FFE6_9BACL|nr:phosphatase PAP2 family protein [Paenibacillus lutrae]
MLKVIHWMHRHEIRMFLYVNQRFRGKVLDAIVGTLTHLGGATATITVTLLLALFGNGAWQTTGIQALAALAVSHIPVALVKRFYPRRRPYLVIPNTRISMNPLEDHSFPSGHSTAIFAVTVPFVAAFPPLGFVLIPLALAVALSRMYLGLHYPSDCLAGALLGTGSAIASVSVWP